MTCRLGDAFVVRTPALPAPTITALLAQPSIADEDIGRLFDDPFVQEAIFLASPVLYEEARRWRGGGLQRRDARRVTQSLLKYLIRMSTRATPFGLFASCATGMFGDVTSGALDARLRRTTRLDMDLACQLAQRLTAMPDIRAHLRLVPNSTLYRAGNEVRFFEYWYDARRKRRYRLVAIETNAYLLRVLELARSGARLDDLAPAIADADVSLDEATSYVSDLVDNQVLVGDLEPGLTDTHFLDSLIERMPATASGTSAREMLDAVRAALCRWDAGATNAPSDYTETATAIRRLVPDATAAALFQVDAFRPSALTLSADVRSQVMAAVEVLARLAPREPLPRLERFRRAFRERFADRRVPLLVALDSDLGVAYGRRTAMSAPLLDGLDVTTSTTDAADGPAPASASAIVTECLLPKVLDALLARRGEVVLDDGDLQKWPAAWETLPASFTVWFSVIALDGVPRVLVHGGGGTTAAAPLGRFSHLDAGIRQQLDVVAAHETAQCPGTIVAEVLHLPEDRVGNVLLRPPFRTYEIPCQARPGVPLEAVIALDDLQLSVPHAGPFRLWSERLQQEVVPRLSTAHRYSAEELMPVYRLLCDLQAQETRTSLGWPSEQLLAALPRVPRVRCRDTVLAPARWRMSGASLEQLRTHLGANGSSALNGWWTEQLLPPQVLLVDSDNTLYIDARNAECRDLLAAEIKGRPAATFVEYLFGGDGAWIASAGGSYVNEVIACCFRERADA